MDKILNSLVYRTLFYVNIYGSFKFSKNSPVFNWPTLYYGNARSTSKLTRRKPNIAAQHSDCFRWIPRIESHTVIISWMAYRTPETFPTNTSQISRIIAQHWYLGDDAVLLSCHDNLWAFREIPSLAILRGYRQTIQNTDALLPALSIYVTAIRCYDCFWYVSVPRTTEAAPAWAGGYAPPNVA